MALEVSTADANGDLARKLEELGRELAEAREQQAATAGILAAISNAPTDLQRVFADIAMSAARLCDAYDATIFLVHGDLLRRVANHGPIPQDDTLPLTRGVVTGRAVLDGRTIQVTDAQAETGEYPEGSYRARLRGHRTILAVPLIRAGKAIGVISIRRLEVRPLTDRQIELLQVFADQAVIAIENTRLFEAEQAGKRELQESLEYQSAISDVLDVSSRSPGNLQPVLDTIVKISERLCHADRAQVYQLENGKYRVVAHRNTSDEFLAYLKENPYAFDRSTTTGRAASERKSIHVPNVEMEIDYDPSRQMGSPGGARLSVPLLRNGVAIGVITAARNAPTPFTDAQIALVETFADQAVIAIENTRLFEAEQTRTRELSLSLEQQTATSEVLQVISSSPTNVQPVFDAIVRRASSLCGGEHAIVTRYDGMLLHLVAQQNPRPGAYEETARFYPQAPRPDGALSGRALLNRTVVHIPDIETERLEPSVREAYRRIGLRAVLCVPMVHEGQPVGVVSVSRGTTGPFSDSQIDLLKTFADQAVIAIENTRLFEAEQASKRELQESLEYQTATSEVLNVISRSPTELQPVLDAIAATAARLCESTDAVVWRVAGGKVRVVAQFGSLVNTSPLPLTRKSVTGRAIVDQRTMHVHDLAALVDTEYPDVKERQQQIGHRTVLAAPLLSQGEALGAISVRKSRVHAFSDRQIALLRTFADQAVIAIENTRLFEAEQTRTKELAEALEQQTATSEVLGVISSSPGELEPVFQAMLANATRLCEAKFGAMYLFEGDAFRAVALHGGPPSFVEARRRNPVLRPIPGTGLGRVAATKQTVQIADVQVEPAYRSTPEWAIGLELGGIRSVLCVPMLKEDELIGAFNLFRHEVRPFTDKQIALVTNFAAQAVIAIENTRLFEAEQTRTRELQESLEYQSATSEVLSVIARAPSDLQQVLDAVAETAARACMATEVRVFRLEGDKLRRAAGVGRLSIPDGAGLSPDLPIGRGSVTGRAVVERRTIHVEDLAREIESEFQDVALMQKTLGHRTTLATPLLRDGDALGAILVLRTEVAPFSDKQIRLLETFADQAVIAIENARLFEEVQARTRELTESLEYQTATSDVLGVISRSPSELQPVVDAIVQTAKRLCSAERANMWRLRAGKFDLLANTHQEFATFLRENPIPADRNSLAGRAVLERRAIHVPDMLADPELSGQKQIQHSRNRTMLVVPLLRESQPIGALSLAKTEVQPFTDKQIELVTTFADQAVIAIENTRLFEEVQARTRELAESLAYQTATSEVLGVISRAPSQLQPVFDAIVSTARRLCQADNAFVYTLVGDTYRLATSDRADEEYVEFLRENPIAAGRGTLVGRVSLEKCTVHLPDATTAPEYDWCESPKRGNFRTMLGVPLIRDGVVIGVIAMVRRVVSPFTHKQIDLVTTFADQALIAIQNVRLFDEVQARTRELARSVQELQALGEVGRAVSSTLDLKVVLKTIVDRAVHLSGTDAGSIFHYRKESGTFELGETTGLSEEFVARLRKLDISVKETGPGEAISSRQPLQIPDLSQHPSDTLRDAVLAAGFRASLVVPLLSGEGPLGALILRRRQPGEFPAAVVSLMQSFADQSAIALENARLFEEIAHKSQELEIASRHKSQFVANMSHELRTPLAAILGYAELMQEGFYEPLGQKSLDALTRIRSNGKHLLGLINTVLDIAKIESGQFNLNLAEYAMGNVVDTVRAATESLAETKKLTLKTGAPTSLPIGFGDEQRLTQVLLNLVGNAIKFTDMGEVHVTARAENGHFAVSVADTGPGIPADQLTRVFEQFHQVDSSNTKAKGGTGLGLAISKQIVEMHGGRIWVESILGKGSTFHMELPVRAAIKGAA